MPGLISNAIAPNDKLNPTVYGADTSNYDATTRAVDPAKETVAGQLRSLLASGNPYIEAAKAGSAETANARGLLNSSIAAGAGEKAAIESALPIATADANIFGTAAQQNQAFQNQAGQFNAAATNTSNLNTANAANTSLLSGQQTEQQKELAQQAAGIQTGQIIPAQTQAQQQIIGTQTGAQKELAAQQAGLQTQQIIPAQTQAQQTLAAQQAALQAGTVIPAQTEAQSRLQIEQSNQKIAQLIQSGQQDQALQELKGQQAQLIANIEAQYKGVTQTSASAGAVMAQTTKNISDILASPDTSVEQKQSAVNAQVQLLQASLAVFGGIAGVDTSQLLDFSFTP